MNIFRKFQTSEDLLLKLETYEAQIKELESSYASLADSNKALSEQVIELAQNLQSKEVVIEEKEQVIESLEVKIEESVKAIEEKQVIIEEVIENTSSIEKQAAIKALEILADCGANEAVEVIEAPEEIDIMAQIKKLKGKELVEFYNANKGEYLAALKK